MVLSTLASTVDVYIVVLDVEPALVRALLFDSQARRVEGYAAQLPARAEAAVDCLDEIHRLAQGAGFRVGAVVGREETALTPEDREYWPAFREASWFPALPEGAGLLLGMGCVGCEQFALRMGERSSVATVVENAVQIEGLNCAAMDGGRWMLSGEVQEAGAAYAAFKQAIKGSVEKYLECAPAEDPMLAALDAAGLRFREVYEKLAAAVGAPREVIGWGGALLKSPSLSRRIADALGVPLTLSTEPEAVCRGGALWALEKIGAIKDLRALAPSLGAVFAAGAVNLETTNES